MGRAGLWLGVALALVLSGSALGASGESPQTFKLLIALEHPRGLEREVRRVSDPEFPGYRDYDSVAQIARRFGADRASKAAVARWVRARGGTSRVAPTGDFVVARMPAGATRKAPGGRVAVPRSLAGAVDSITVADPEPVYRTARTATARRDTQAPHSGTAAGCPEALSAPAPEPGNGFTPNQYLEAYGHAALHARGITGKGVRFAVIEIDGYDPNDIQTFGECFGIRIPPLRPHAVGIPKLLAPGDETTLDLEVLSAGAPGARSIDVYENDGTQVGLLNAVAAALAAKRPPDVISISLGECEPDLTGDLAPNRQLNRVFGAAAAAGISVFVSAGDQGSSACARPPSALDLLAVSSPADSHYVTAVGGTNVTLDAANRITGQVVWNDSPNFFGGGGGGISIIYDLPLWQGVAKRFSGDARTLPDIAALADVTPGYVLYCTAAPCREFQQTTPGWISVGGTSAAAPLMAAGVALADQAAWRQGQENVGFVNPLIYDLATGKDRAKVLSDVVVGDNDLGAMLTPPDGGPPEPLGCCSAKPGYDAASGLGSLRVDGFSAIAAKVAQANAAR